MTNPTQQQGNRNSTASFADVCEALKNNIMRNLSVAELVTITSVNDAASLYKTSLLSNPSQTIECTKLQELDVKVNDVMLAIFTNTDFRTNLSKVKNGQAISEMKNQTLHSKNYGVLVGLIYRKQNEGEQN